MKKLEAYGFFKDGDVYVYEKDLEDRDFKSLIRIGKDGKISGKVIEKELDEEYLAIRYDRQNGAYVSKIREEYIAILEDIRKKCFEDDPFIYPQAMRVAAYIRKEYAGKPEYLWDKYPGYGVFRNGKNGKWFAIIMNVSGKKLDLDDEEYEIIDVKADERTIASLVNEKGFFPGYHMNKGSWLSILLNDTLADEVIFSLIDASHGMADVSSAWIVPANPAYYDVVSDFRKREVIEWKQSSAINVGDLVYLYVGQPYSAVLYKCIAEEVDIPYQYSDRNVSMSRLMRIRRIKVYPKDAYTFKWLNEHGIRAVRGPRRLSQKLVELLD